MRNNRHGYFPGFIFAAPFLAFAVAVTFLIAPGAFPAQAATVTTETEVVDVNFVSAATSGSTITNSAVGKFADLTAIGSPLGINTADGINFDNTLGSVSQYLKGNLGTTSNMSKVVVEFTAKFPDNGCALQNSGSMVFGFGTSSSSYVPYNIYRHSNFIGLNTFSSDIYGISLPDNSTFHTYKFVMVAKTTGFALQEIYLDGAIQSLAYRTTGTGSGGCGAISGVSESNSNRIFTNSGYSNGDFLFMTHALSANTWRTTGSVRSLKVTTTASVSTPTAPTISSLTTGNEAMSVAFTAPTSNGGAAISGYKHSTDGGANWSTSSARTSPFAITGLINGTEYSVMLRAVNSAGDGANSNTVSGTPATTSSAPTVTAVAPGDAQLSVSFTAPASNGGSVITGYKYSTDDGANWSTSSVRSSPFAITGLSNGTSYDVKLRAVNTKGDGLASNRVAATPNLTLNVTYDPVGGSFVTPGTFVSGGTIAVAPTNPTRNGHTFSGWAATNTGAAISFPYSPGGLSDITLFALWEAVVVVPSLTPTLTGAASPAPTPPLTAATTPRPSASATPKRNPSPVPVATATTSPNPTQLSPVPAITIAPSNIFISAPNVGNGITKPEPGMASTFVDGQQLDALVTKTDFDTKLELPNSMSVSLVAVDAAGEPVALSSAGVMELVDKYSIRASGFGFKPDSPVEVWLNSEPKYLGTGFSNFDGTFDNTFSLVRDIPIGVHTLVLYGLSPADEVVTLALSVALSQKINVTDEAIVETFEEEKGRSIPARIVFLALVALLAIALIRRRAQRQVI